MSNKNAFDTNGKPSTVLLTTIELSKTRPALVVVRFAHIMQAYLALWPSMSTRLIVGPFILKALLFDNPKNTLPFWSSPSLLLFF